MKVKAVLLVVATLSSYTVANQQDEVAQVPKGINPNHWLFRIPKEKFRSLLPSLLKEKLSNNKSTASNNNPNGIDVVNEDVQQEMEVGNQRRFPPFPFPRSFFPFPRPIHSPDHYDKAPYSFNSDETVFRRINPILDDNLLNTEESGLRQRENICGSQYGICGSQNALQ